METSPTQLSAVDMIHEADLSPPIRDLSPPGDILAEAIEERGVTCAELARRLGCTEEHVSQLVNGKVPLTTDMALQLEQVLTIPAQFWNALEFNYRSEQKRSNHEIPNHSPLQS